MLTTSNEVKNHLKIWFGGSYVEKYFVPFVTGVPEKFEIRSVRVFNLFSRYVYYQSINYRIADYLLVNCIGEKYE